MCRQPDVQVILCGTGNPSNWLECAILSIEQFPELSLIKAVLGRTSGMHQNNSWKSHQLGPVKHPAWVG